ncbi:hypothetical protein, partial [Nonomuraea turkmeniaca]|uniref:hypothetical protein n=1 Tax=Nonomuraea turkmeniaca TaxID=103838 RepID=UPI001B8746AE
MPVGDPRGLVGLLTSVSLVCWLATDVFRGRTTRGRTERGRGSRVRVTCAPCGRISPGAAGGRVVAGVLVAGAAGAGVVV